ncbi:hypothetical protein MHBO_004130 [Bonamia ostreae]|uniref:Uncharacterized protein n=1 Tax=Bonamia ostreae TaxID=126728 RepID=A0ABV2AT99_9EUKA
MVIEGYGRFKQSLVSHQVIGAYKAPTASTFKINGAAVGFVAPTVNTALVVDIELLDLRNPAGSGRNVIKHGSHVLVEVTLTAAATTQGLVWAEVQKALVERKKIWPNLDDEVIATLSGAADVDITFTTASSTTGVKSVKLLASTEGNRPSGLFTKTSLTEFSPVAYCVYTPGDEGENSGKWLEENVMMADPANIDYYGMRPGETPVLNGAYTSFYFRCKPWADGFQDMEHVSPIWNHTGYQKSFEFNVWVQQTGTIATSPSVKHDTIKAIEFFLG